MRKLALILVLILISRPLFAADFIMTKEPIKEPIEGDRPSRYTFIYSKVIKDINDKDVTVKDEGKTVTQTKQDILSQRAFYQAEVDICDARLAEIAKIGE